MHGILYTYKYVIIVNLALQTQPDRSRLEILIRRKFIW